jgi:hypothetical protein
MRLLDNNPPRSQDIELLQHIMRTRILNFCATANQPIGDEGDYYQHKEQLCGYKLAIKMSTPCDYSPYHWCNHAHQRGS